MPKANMHLVPSLLNAKRLAMRPTRDGFGEGLVLAAEKDGSIVGLCADLTESTRMLPFKEKFPERFIQMGVHEQLLTAMSAGLALAGKVPFIASYAMFCPGRSWEQVRTNICLNNANVKIAGAHAGVSVGPDGATHQAIEDIAILRAIPNITIVVPCDAEQTKKATLAVAKMVGPAYLRFGREKSPVFTTPKTPFEIGKAQVFRPGKDVAIIACGILVHNALLAAEALAKQGLDCMVVNNHTVKPMDVEGIVAAAEECGAVVTVEEHQMQGGMGSRVAEVLASRRPTPIEFVGVDDRFGESGDPMQLIEHFGMGVPHIVAAALRAAGRKGAHRPKTVPAKKTKR
jgi:transketolase